MDDFVKNAAELAEATKCLEDTNSPEWRAVMDVDKRILFVAGMMRLMSLGASFKAVHDAVIASLSYSFEETQVELFEKMKLDGIFGWTWNVEDDGFVSFYFGG